MDEFLYEPFYQAMRLRLLADRMVRERQLGVSDAKVVVVVPKGEHDILGEDHFASVWPSDFPARM